MYQPNTSGSAASNITFLEAELARDRRDDVGAPGGDLLGDSFGLDHDHVGAGIQAASGQVNRVADVAGAFLLEFLRGGGAAGAELDPDLGFRLHASALDALDQAQDVVGGDADEAGGDLEDVEAQAGDLVDVAVCGVGALCEDVFDEPAG